MKIWRFDLENYMSYNNRSSVHLYLNLGLHQTNKLKFEALQYPSCLERQTKDISRRLSKIITQNIYASSAKLSANLPGNGTPLCADGDRRPNCDQSPNRTY